MKQIKTFQEYDMYDNAYNTLRARYPLSEGWSITPQEHHGTYIPDYVIQKTTKNKIIKVIAEVKKCVITQNDISQLKGYARNLAGPNVTIQSKIFIVASGANTSLVPNDIEVIYLKKFVCNG